MSIDLPAPAAGRVLRETLCPRHDDTLEYVVVLEVRDAAHGNSLQAVLRKAKAEGYAIELRLIHYGGYPDTNARAAARKAKKSG